MWANKPLVVFHGTDSGSASGLVPNIAFCKPRTDFGQGFYTTTRLHQAKQWANLKFLRRRSGLGLHAVVLQYDLDRDWLASLDALSFVRETADFWEFVNDCRSGIAPHQRVGLQPSYDTVNGLVTLWPQRIVLSDCDQYSFHTQRALGSFPRPSAVHSAISKGRVMF